MLLLHGFPDFWYGWRHQIGPLAAAGYRGVAPDQRGYNRSDKTRPVRAYRLAVLAGDVLRLADAVRSCGQVHHGAAPDGQRRGPTAGRVVSWRPRSSARSRRPAAPQ